MQENLSCCCHDSQTVFLDHAMQHLDLDAAQRKLLLQSFREVTVQIPLRLRKEGRETLHTSAYELAVRRSLQAIILRGF